MSFEAEQQRRLIDTYWEELRGDGASIWEQFKGAAVAFGSEIAAPPEHITRYIDLADELRVEGSGRDVALLPRAVEGVPIGLSKLHDKGQLLTDMSRFVMPFLAVTPIGGAFKVLDLTFKAASWFSSCHLFKNAARADVTPRLIPAAHAELVEWTSKSGRKAVGSSHRTLLGELFVSAEEVLDQITGARSHVVGIRDDKGSPSSTSMFLIRLI